MKAEIEIECKNPEIIIKALKPDIGDAKKFKVELETNKNKLKLKVEAENMPGLLAGINSYMRLIRTSINSTEA